MAQRRPARPNFFVGVFQDIKARPKLTALAVCVLVLFWGLGAILERKDDKAGEARVAALAVERGLGADPLPDFQMRLLPGVGMRRMFQCLVPRDMRNPNAVVTATYGAGELTTLSVSRGSGLHMEGEQDFLLSGQQVLRKLIDENHGWYSWSDGTFQMALTGPRREIEGKQISWPEQWSSSERVEWRRSLGAFCKLEPRPTPP